MARNKSSPGCWRVRSQSSIRSSGNLLGSEKKELKERIAGEGWGAAFLSCREFMLRHRLDKSDHRLRSGLIPVMLKVKW